MMILAIVLILVLVVCDQLIKAWCVDNLVLHESVDFIRIGKTKIFDLTLHENNGAVFGSMAGKRVFLIVVVVAVMGVCIYTLIRYGKQSKVLYSSMILLISGGIGNLIDRVFNGGKVIDMFDFQLFNFAIFNFADICITVGAFMLVLYTLFSDLKSQKKTATGGEEKDAE